MSSMNQNYDTSDKIIDVSKLRAQLLNAKVVLEKLEEPLIKSFRRFPRTRAISVQANDDLDDDKDVTRETSSKDCTRYCAKCKKTVIVRFQDPTTKNCSDCKTAMTFLCTKCNVRDYKRYPFLKSHWNRCKGNGTSTAVDRNASDVKVDTSTVDERIINESEEDESHFEDTSDADAHIDSYVALDEDQFIVKKISDDNFMKQCVRYCSGDCDEVVTNDINRCSKCNKYAIFACKKCNAKYDLKKNLLNHLKSQCYPANKYQCTRCKYTTNTWEKMRKHFQNMHTDRPKFKCQFCPHETKYKNNLIIHVQHNHRGKRIDKRRQKKSIEDTAASDAHVNSLDEALFSVRKIGDGILTDKYYRYCSKCDTAVQTRVSRCSTCSKYLEFACKKCNAKQKSCQAMVYHLTTQCYPANEYQCKHCQHTTTNCLSMRKHFKNIHTSLPKFKCELCTLETKYKQNFEQHLKAVHHMDKPKFYCQNCTYWTNSKDNIQRHQKLSHH